MMQSLPLWANALVFAIASAVIWWAGTRLERYADAISDKTGIGQAFGGLLLLAVATSLPELATTITAVVVLNNPTLAVHNLLGGVALQTGVLAIADATKGKRGALTFFSPDFSLLTQGVGLLLLLQLTVAGVVAQGVPTAFSISLWPVLIGAAYVALMYLSYRYRGQPRWTPSKLDDIPPEARPEHVSEVIAEERAQTTDRPTKHLYLLFAGASLLVLVGGWFAAQSADILAEQSGLGDAFLGATLLALATSLPELSTTTAACRDGRYTMATSNIFGSNACDVALLLVAELLYRDGTVLANADLSLVFVTATGAAMTCVYLWGLMERENRTVFGVGWDSAAAVLIYMGGMAVLYSMQ